jgi:limonene-1,2-epoxide hydrolase
MPANCQAGSLVIAMACLGFLVFPAVAQSGPPTANFLAQAWVDGWNSPDPEKLAEVFTSDGIYQDVPFALNKKGATEIRELHRFFHEAVGGLYVKLIAAHVAGGHGTIEWFFGGNDVGVFKSGKSFEVRGVSVIDVVEGRISLDRDYYDVATIMKQVGALR